MTLRELLALLRKHLALMIVLPIVFGLAAGAYCYQFMSDSFTATASMYVLVKNNADDGKSSLASDLSTSQMITNDVAALLTSDRVTDAAAADLGMKSLGGYKVSVSSATTSRVISITVTGADAEGVASVANALTDKVSEIAQQAMDVQSINVIDSARTPAGPSGPNRKLYVAVAVLGGLFVAVAIAILAEVLNTKVRGQEELEELLGIPVLGRIPEVQGKA
ncbi:MAG: Wzz/FepE/Etk N-terminal domain-containing protein [Coriobacteriia bacterium]|nr:Wzz/FepE/Etk N-terminal domain-containing protein [Coriobacteriia bacterium]